ncbi:MAG TPA: universal stress protein [Jatrophihabitans sp.]|nr:universal stress protein [Jatrophihabitans sp.]
MSEFGVVVVGVDGSDVADDALVFAANEASRRRARLIVAHGADAPEAHTTEVAPFADILCREAMATVAGVQPHVDCEVVRRSTNPAELLVELSGAADLLIVGTHRTGRLRGFVLGSVSQRVAAHARCPVITISGPANHDAGPIILGASASPGGLAALRFACEEARIRGVAVHAVRSIFTEDWAIAGPGFAMVGGPEILEEAARIELDTVLDEARGLFPDVEIHGAITRAHFFTALLAAAADGAMLVIGSRRRQDSPLPHLGPIAAWLLHQAQCPLAVVGYAAADVSHAAMASANTA